MTTAMRAPDAPQQAPRATPTRPRPRPARRERTGRARRPFARLSMSLAVLVALLLAWQGLTVVFDAKFFPPAFDVLANIPDVLRGSDGTALTQSPLFTDVFASILRMAAGFALGTIIGVSAGVVIGRWAPARDMVMPIIEFLRSIPATAVLPIFIMLLGLGPNMQILFIAWGVTWFVLINTASGVATVHPTLINACKVFQTGPVRMLFGIVLPSASPKIFAGMRIGLTAAMILIVTSEFMGATNGIGYLLIEGQRRFRLLDMWSWMVVIAVVGYLANTVLELVEGRVLRWYNAARR